MSLPDSTVVDATLSDDAGNFSLNRDCSDKTVLRTSFSGYKVSETSCNDTVNIILMPINTELQEVVVTAGKGTLQASPGKFTYIPGGLAMKAGNALDALKFTPLVSISVDGDVDIFSAGSSEIWINGKAPRVSKEATVAMLKTLPPSKIKKVEIITSPGVLKEGGGGILNVELAPEDDGWCVSASAYNWYNRDRFTFTPSIYAKYQKGRFHSSSMLVYVNANDLAKNEDSYHYKLTDTFINNNFTSTGSTNILNALIDFSYDINRNSYIGIGGQIYCTKLENKNITHTENIYGENNRESFRTEVYSCQPFKYPEVKLAAFYSLNFPNRNASLDLDLSYIGVHSSSWNDYYLKESTRFDKNTNRSDGIFAKALFRKKFAFGGSMNLGCNFSNESNSFGVNSSETSISNDFKVKRTIGSLYVDFTHQFDFNLGVSAGLRGSYTKDRINQHTTDGYHVNDYFDFLPSLNLAYTFPGDKNSLNLSYNSYLYRPNVSSLNPFIFLENENVGSSGNPDLKSHVTQNIGIIYNNSCGFSFSTRYLRSKGGFDGYRYDNNKTIKMRLQGGVIDDVFIELSYNKELFSIWNLTLWGSPWYHHAKFKEYPDGNVHSWSYSVGISNKVLIVPKWNLFASLDYSYGSKRSYSMSNRSAYNNLNFTLQKQFDFGLNVVLYAYDLLPSGYDRDFDGINYSYYFKDNIKCQSTIRLDLIYTIGNYKVKEPKKISTSGTL